MTSITTAARTPERLARYEAIKARELQAAAAEAETTRTR